MNSNYQVNKFYAQEKMNAHLQAAEAHRLARKANREKKNRIVARAANYLSVGAGSLVNQIVHSLVSLGKAPVNPDPYLGRKNSR